MKNLGLRAQLVLGVAIFSLAGVGYGITVNGAMKENLGESEYRSVSAYRDLIADILPPPMYLIEAYSVALEMVDTPPGGESAKLVKRWRRLESEWQERLTFWNQYADNLGVDAALPMINEQAGELGEQFFTVGNDELLPAVASRDPQAMALAVRRVMAAYYEHRKGIDKLVALAKAETRRAEKTAAATIAARKNALLIGGSLALVVCAAIAIYVAQNIVRRTRLLGTVLKDVAAGDLTRRGEVDANDELGAIADLLNKALGTIEEAFREVRDVTQNLAQTAPALAHSSDEMSDGAQRQAASLEETAASLEEIAATVKQTAHNAQQANQLAQQSRDVAEQGGKVVHDAVSAMYEVRSGSRRIGDIITTIDEVALQTNLLALNAAVEAARAGEQGRGFAVVAAEVGNLAQRSATAAKEVKALIEDSLERVENGHHLVEQSGKSLQGIISSVIQVTEVVGEIATAAREQSQGVDQVNQAVSQMDQVTQSSANRTLELSEAAEQLALGTQRLRITIDRFRVHDGALTHTLLQPPAHDKPLPLHSADRKLGLANEPAPGNDNYPQVERPKAAGAEDFEVV